MTKSRQALHANNKGDYQLVTGRNNIVILGADYDATLEEIDAYLNEH